MDNGGFEPQSPQEKSPKNDTTGPSDTFSSIPQQSSDVPSAPSPSSSPPPPASGSQSSSYTPQVNASVHKPRSGVGAVLFFLILFAIGIGLSYILRDRLPNLLALINPRDKITESSQDETPANEEEMYIEDEYGNIIVVTPEESDSLEETLEQTWFTYDVINGNTKEPDVSVTYQLPKDVLEPICDGINCASQGTYLPGGTRFTVAARGEGQVLDDYRDAIISDLSGRAFEVSEVKIGDRNAVSFSADFTGATVGGYSFTKMRGLMIEINDTQSVEFNHFTPTGVDADFDSDDVIFEQILQSITIGGNETYVPVNQEKGAESMTPSEDMQMDEEMESETSGQFCGGPENIACPEGYICKFSDEGLSDSGVCVPF